MKPQMMILGVALAVLISTSAQVCAQAPKAGFGAFIGYKSVDTGQQKFSHDTHPDDGFLPGAGSPGSAGLTEVGGRLHFASLGFRYQAPIAKSFSINIDLGGLLGGERDRHQNANDDRPPSEGSFVYSEARYGLFAAAGVSYHIKHFYFGAEAQLAGIFVDSGWDRFGEDESQSLQMRLVPSGGPKIGYELFDGVSVEGTVQFGRSINFSLQFVWKY